jgi:two-component sensor histidine kinase
LLERFERERLSPREPPIIKKEPTMAAQVPTPPEPALDLALAVVASSYTPLLLLSGELMVIAVSASFCDAFQVDPTATRDRPFFEMGAGEWDVPQLGPLLRATAAGHAQIQAYEMDLKRKGRETCQLLLNVQKLAYGEQKQVLLLLAVSDITDARIAEKLKNEMLLDKAMLLQELQHRVANSLQIIASVLLQSARRVQSDESRSHLQAAHQRVMSVAAMQKQLAISAQDEVELRPYFTDLCESLGASMIRDRDQLSLVVHADATVTSADVSVSLGLIVTELVINALKHAFPGERGGMIIVDYRAKGTDWTLSVRDNGVGKPKSPERAKVGLGTSIVSALAKQLHARVEFDETSPGTSVSIIYPLPTTVRDVVQPIRLTPKGA